MAGRKFLDKIPGAGAKLFEHGSSYSSFRPTYPVELYNYLFQYAKPSPPSSSVFGFAVDVGCGSGQATTELAKQYKSVLAFDASPSQIKNAPKLPNIDYKVAPSEDLLKLVPSNSADLIVVAQALHWFDIPVFYKQAFQSLRPGGTLAVWSYGTNVFENNKAAEASFYDLYEGKLGKYWNDRRQLVETGLKGYEPPCPPFEKYERKIIPLRVTMAMRDFVGYIRTWSAYQEFKKQHAKEEDDPLPEAVGKLMEAFGLKSLEKNVEIRWEIFFLFVKKPLPPPFSL